MKINKLIGKYFKLIMLVLCLMIFFILAIKVFNDSVVKSDAFGYRIVSNYLIRDNQLVGVSLKDGRKILAHCVFLAIGHIPNSELFDGEKRDGYIVVNSNGETSKKDVYACGDVIDKSIYQLVTASSEGVVVATSIIQNNQK